jgi:LDH2 family malate/lactate/ureidoglycolate dehydrogenase
MMKIRAADAAGEKIPDGWATDAAGVPTTDPTQAIKGMLLPAAGAKGFALAALIDLVAGGLSSGAIGEEVRPLYGDPRMPYRCAHLFLGIDIARFRPVEDFAAVAEGLASRVRASRPVVDGAAVRMPGDRAVAARAGRTERCPIARSTLDALVKLAAQLNVPVPAGLES